MAQDPLHGVTLQAIVEALQARYGWPGLAERVDIRCFKSDPSVKSSLKFLRATPWARAEVEALYLADLRRAERNRKRNEDRALRRARAAEAVATGESEPLAGVAEPGEGLTDPKSMRAARRAEDVGEVAAIVP